MPPGIHRPHNEEYWQEAWSSVLFQGDLFKAIPFADQRPDVFETEEEPGKHFLGPVQWGYGLLVTPTCDMFEQDGSQNPAHPFRVLVPIVPISLVLVGTGGLEENLGLLRSRDALRPYVYLPPLNGTFEESVACLFRPSLVSDELLAQPPRRIAQLQPEARRHLKIKLAAYWARSQINKDDMPLGERFEDDVRSPEYPPSRYDATDGP